MATMMMIKENLCEKAIKFSQLPRIHRANPGCLTNIFGKSWKNIWKIFETLDETIVWQTFGKLWEMFWKIFETLAKPGCLTNIWEIVRTYLEIFETFDETIVWHIFGRWYKTFEITPNISTNSSVSENLWEIYGAPNEMASENFWEIFGTLWYEIV